MDGEEEGLMMEAIKTKGILPIVHPHSFSENHRRSRNKVALSKKVKMVVFTKSIPSVIPSRRFYPGAYRLYMELLKRHVFSFVSQINCPNYEKVMKSIDEILHLSQIFALPTSEPGLLVVGFVFSIVWQLLDASLDDEGLLELTAEKKSSWLTGTQEMEIDGNGNFEEKRTERQEGMLKLNTVMAVEIIGEFFKHKVTSRILYLARRNICSHWGYFIQHLRLLAANSSALTSSKDITPDALLQLTSDTRQVLSRKCKTSSQKQFHAVIACGSPASSASQCHGTSRSAFWLPFDLFMEDSMDGSQVATTSAVEVLTGTYFMHFSNHHLEKMDFM
ncbi:hypothetical protein RHGRI_035729 [Rhododendron griersonianum]|uniref:Uncharacterized protein n=1 Tax=Rhododendron griersonianum TaxID=479676 RepID=A0AAV6HPD5_9ERIC|nr:hypothetical protein RHGRI_035729 [Rhododendron griersonianum]